MSRDEDLILHHGVRVRLGEGTTTNDEFQLLEACTPNDLAECLRVQEHAEFLPMPP